MDRRTSMNQPRALPSLALALALVLSITASSIVRAEDGFVHRCFGRVATIVGTNGHDSINGTVGDDIIVGLRGNDFINGRAGNDRICGGGGNDASDFVGGESAPGLEGGSGNDRVLGGPGFDDVNGGPVAAGEPAGTDVLLGGRGPDVLCDNWCFRDASAGEPQSTGPDDRLFGGKDAIRDRLLATGGNDRSAGGPGDDAISAADGVSGNDVVDGGSHVEGDACSADVGDTVMNCNP
jgi:Ca2+-binding RTX toxin-like protein